MLSCPFTGAVGKPTWGTWWVWDARLTAMLILLFLYFGVIALQAAIDDLNVAKGSFCFEYCRQYQYPHH